MIILGESSLKVKYKCVFFCESGIISIDTKYMSDNSQSYLINQKQGFQISLDDDSKIITDAEILAPKINKIEKNPRGEIEHIHRCTPSLEILSIDRSDIYMHDKIISIYFADDVCNGIYISGDCEFLHHNNQLICLRFKDFFIR